MLVDGYDDGQFPVDVHQLLQYRRGVESGVNILRATDDAHSASVVSTGGQFLYRGECSGQSLQIFEIPEDVEIGCGYVVVPVVLFLKDLVFDDAQRFRVRKNADSLSLLYLQGFQANIFYFDGQRVDLTAKGDDRLFVPDITLHKSMA